VKRLLLPEQKLEAMKRGLLETFASRELVIDFWAGPEPERVSPRPSVGQASLDGAAQPRQTPAAIGKPGHENSIGSEVGATTKGTDMAECKIYGPFEDRGKFRVRVTDVESKKTTAHTFASRAEAEAAIPRLRREYERSLGKPLAKALADYAKHLDEVKGNKADSIAVTIDRITGFLVRAGGLGNVVTGDLTPKQVDRAWEEFRTKPGPRSKKLPAVDTQVGVLKQTRTFFRWCVARKWMKADLLEGAKAEGKRRRGKVQLRGVDEARRFLGLALREAGEGDAGAIAAAVALVLGVRASEILDRTVNDIDDRGTVLVIPEAKTAAGIRRLALPEILRPLLASLAEGKSGDDRLFPPAADKNWMLRSVKRLCKAAGVRVVTSHGLRGTQATLSVETGMAGMAIAKHLGHEDFGITSRHYARPEAIEGARVGRFLAAVE